MVSSSTNLLIIQLSGGLEVDQPLSNTPIQVGSYLEVQVVGASIPLLYENQK